MHLHSDQLPFPQAHHHHTLSRRRLRQCGTGSPQWRVASAAATWHCLLIVCCPAGAHRKTAVGGRNCARAQQRHDVVVIRVSSHHLRLPQALAAMRHWEAAVARSRAGEALAAGRHGRSADFEALLDGIALDAAMTGSDAGFDGRRLEVSEPIFKWRWVELADRIPKSLQADQAAPRPRRCWTASR